MFDPVRVQVVLVAMGFVLSSQVEFVAGLLS